MKITVSYQYTVYKGCDRATELSRQWETIRHTIAFAMWLFVAGGGLIGAWALSDLIKSEYNATTILQLFIFLCTFAVGYTYVYYSKHVYPKCEELFYLSQKTQANANVIDRMILEIRDRRKEAIRKALTKYFLIYFLIFLMYFFFFLYAKPV